MLSKNSHRFLIQHYKVSAFLHAIPFKWDSKAGRVICLSRFRKLICILNVLLSLAMTAWMYRTVYIGVTTGNRPVSKLSVDFLYVFVYLIYFIFQYETWTKTDEMAQIMNRLLQFDRSYTKKYLPPPDPDNFLVSGQEESQGGKRKKPKKEREKPDGCDDNIFSSLYMAFVYAALIVSAFVKNPEDGRYLYSAFPMAPEEKPEWLFYLWAGVEFIYILKFCMTFNNIFYIFIIYAHTGNYWLNELSRPTEKVGEEKKITVPVLNREVIPNYRTFQVLNAHFNACCAQLLIPAFKLLNISLHVIAIFVSVTFHAEIPAGEFAMFPIGVVMWFVIESDVYFVLGKINELSEKYKISWKLHMGKSYAKTFKSLRSLGVKVSIAYSMSKTTCLIVWSIVFDLVIDLICMY